MSGGYLEEERKVVREAVQSLELTAPWVFEFSPASPAPPGSVALKAVGASDMLLLIVSNKHTQPVQDELDEAARLEKPILAFVERMSEEEGSSERQEVIAWLSERVTYKEFSGTEGLGREVLRAIRTELVEGYRERYRGRITDQDIPKLAVREMYPGLVVRTAEQRDADGIEQSLLELKQWYPDIEEWVAKRIAEIGDIDKGEAIRVAEVEGEIGAVAILRDKGNDVRKFATLYVRPTAQGGAIGPHLVREEIMRAAADGVRKAYVTCADEIANRLMPILEQNGFTPEGVSRGRYRDGAAEWVLGKTFIHDEIGPADFGDFVRERIITEAGGEIADDQGDVFTTRLPRLGLAGGQSPELTQYAISTSARPEEDYEAYRRRFEGKRWVFVSLAGRPADVSHELHAVHNWIDAADLAARFFPVSLNSPGQRSLIVTIQPHYADALIPSRQTPSMLDPTRLQVRTDNVYYRTPDRYEDLRRGSRVLFYVSESGDGVRGNIRGSGMVTDVFVGDPEACFERYNAKGILDYHDLEEIARNHHGKVLALSFDWYREFTSHVSLRRLTNMLPKYIPQAAYLLSPEETQEILREGARLAR